MLQIRYYQNQLRKISCYNSKLYRFRFETKSTRTYLWRLKNHKVWNTQTERLLKDICLIDQISWYPTKIEVIYIGLNGLKYEKCS